MVRRRANFGLLKIIRQLLKACGITKPTLSSPTNEIVSHAVYNDWKLAIQLFLRFESFIVANLRVPFEFLIQLFELATKVGSQQIVKMLFILEPLEYDNLLWWAIRHNLFKGVEILLGNGANANSLNKKGYMPIHLAIEVDSPDIVALLVQNGANIDPPKVQGRHLMDYALYYKNDEVIEILLKANANVKSRNDYDEMPIHVAALLGLLDCVKLLKTYGADINAKGAKGWRPIHFAVLDRA